MRQSFVKREQVFAFDHPSVRDFFVARHPVKTAQAVAFAAGVSVRAAQKWLDGTAAPNFAATCRLVAAYGPEFLVICLPAAEWLSAAARMERSARIARDMDRLASELAALDGMAR